MGDQMGCWDTLVQGLQAKPPFHSNSWTHLILFCHHWAIWGTGTPQPWRKHQSPGCGNAVLQSGKHSTVPPSGCPGLPNPIPSASGKAPTRWIMNPVLGGGCKRIGVPILWRGTGCQALPSVTRSPGSPLHTWPEWQMPIYKWEQPRNRGFPGAGGCGKEGEDEGKRECGLERMREGDEKRRKKGKGASVTRGFPLPPSQEPPSRCEPNQVFMKAFSAY